MKPKWAVATDQGCVRVTTCHMVLHLTPEDAREFANAIYGTTKELERKQK